MTPLIFYSLTPLEYYYIVTEYHKAQGTMFNNMGAVVYSAYGQSKAGKKFKPLFQVSPKVKKGDLRDRNKTLEAFKKKGLLKGG